MKKAQVYIILCLISFISCKKIIQEKTQSIEVKSIAEKENNVTTIINNQNTDKSNITTERQVIEENANKLELTFKKIDSTHYLNYKRKYVNRIIIDTTIVNEAGSSFSLNIKNTVEKFSCGKDYNDCTYYRGFLKPLNKYILTHCGEGYCGTYLLDKKTGKIHNLESPFDTECEIPSLSKNENKLIAFSSSVFNQESFISLYKNNKDSNEFEFKFYDSFQTTDWKIKEIIWIDNDSIALKVYDKYGGITGSELINKRYLKTTLK